MAFPLQNFLENFGRAFRLIRIINFNRHKNLGALSIEVSLTTACNYKCYFCNAHSHLKKDCPTAQSLPNEAIDRLLKDIHSLKIPEILFAGDGEPFLHKRFLEIIKACKGEKVKVLTNGSKLEQVSAPLFANIYKLTISLNSIDNETHKLIHGYKGDSQLPHILHNIKRLLSLPKARKKLQINYVVTKDNIHELENVFQLSNEWDAFFAARPAGVGFEEFRSKALSQQQRKTIQEKIEQILQKPSLSPNAIASLKYSKHFFKSEEAYSPRSSLLPCYAGFYGAYLESNGDYRICVHCKVTVGNIIQQNLTELWKNPELQKRLYALPLMKENKTALCPGCLRCPDVETYSALFHKFFSRLPGQMSLLRRSYQKYGSRQRQMN